MNSTTPPLNPPSEPVPAPDGMPVFFNNLLKEEESFVRASCRRCQFCCCDDRHGYPMVYVPGCLRLSLKADGFHVGRSLLIRCRGDLRCSRRDGATPYRPSSTQKTSAGSLTGGTDLITRTEVAATVDETRAARSWRRLVERKVSPRLETSKQRCREKLICCEVDAVPSQQ